MAHTKTVIASKKQVIKQSKNCKKGKRFPVYRPVIIATPTIRTTKLAEPGRVRKWPSEAGGLEGLAAAPPELTLPWLVVAPPGINTLEVGG